MLKKYSKEWSESLIFHDWIPNSFMVAGRWWIMQARIEIQLFCCINDSINESINHWSKWLQLECRDLEVKCLTHNPSHHLFHVSAYNLNNLWKFRLNCISNKNVFLSLTSIFFSLSVDLRMGADVVQLEFVLFYQTHFHFITALLMSCLWAICAGRKEHALHSVLILQYFMYILSLITSQTKVTRQSTSDRCVLNPRFCSLQYIL